MNPDYRSIQRLLVANRGEIACRVMRSARALGIGSVAVHSDIDRHARHVAEADIAVDLGGAKPVDSYLRGDRIIAAALASGAQAIHPGYGFLSENADFARACEEAGLLFLGPPAAAIDAMGSKSAAKALMEEAGVPLVPGYHGEAQDLETFRREAGRIGYPVLLKALEVNDPGNQYGFPYLWGTTGIGYNPAKIKAVLGDDAPLDSWDIFFKPEYMQKLSKCGVAVLDNGPELLPITLNYLGLPHHSQKADDYKQAQAALLKVRPYIRYFHSSKYVSDLANGEICMVVGFSGDILQAATRAKEANNGVEVRYSTPKEGSPLWFDMVSMPVDAPDEKAGYAFMNYLLRPEVMAAISNHVHYANGNLAADPLVDAEIKADPAIYPPQEKMAKLFALESMPQKIDRVRTRTWNTVKTGK